MNEIADLFSLKGKTAVVTGTSAGIGARLARTLVVAGAQVVAMARRTTQLDLPSSSLGELIPMNVDLEQHDQVADAARASLEALGGRVDILVNNAAFLAGGVKAEDESSAQIQQTLAVNLEAPILLAQTFYPGMRAAGGGSIINMGSIVASGGIGRLPQAVYAASKGGPRSDYPGVGGSMEPIRHPRQ